MDTKQSAMTEETTVPGVVALEAPHDPRVTVRLVTQSGHDVTAVKIPPMTPWPEVIMWGSRIFVISDRTNIDPDFVPLYREGIMWHVITDGRGSQIL